MTEYLDLNLYNAVQTADFSISFDRQPLKQVGSQMLASKDIFRQPDVQLSLSYIPEPNLYNEVNGGFLHTYATTRYVNFFSGAGPLLLPPKLISPPYIK